MLNLRLADNALCFIFLLLLSNSFIQVLLSSKSDIGGYQENSTLISILLFIYTLMLLRSLSCWDEFFILFKKTKPLLILILYSLMSSFWSSDLYFTLQKSIALILTVFSAFYLVVFFDPNRFIKLLLDSFFFMMVCSVLLGVFFPSLSVHSNAAHEGLLHGVFPQKQVLGQVASLSLIFTLVFKSSLSTLRCRLQVGIALLCLVFSGSRTALLITALIGSFIFLNEYYLSMISRQKKIIVLLVVLFISVSGLFVYFNTEQFLLSIGKDITFSGRTYLWDYVANDAVENPIIGSGYKTFWNLNSDLIFIYFNYYAVNGHNFILDYYLEQGLLGIVVLSFFLLDYFYTAKKIDRESRLFQIMVCLLLFLICFGMVATIFPNQNSIFTMLFCYIYILSNKNLLLKETRRHCNDN